jgi:hypothetical protein
MAQSNVRSIKEAVINVVVGYLVNYAGNIAIFNGLLHQNITWKQNIVAGVLFTVISLVRSYLIRRWMNKND